MELIDSMEEGPNKTANISMFFDERIETVHAVRRFIITCFLVCKGIWRASSSQAKLVQQTSRKHRLASIDDLLSATKGFAVVTHADLPSEMLALHPRDYAEDVLDVARADNAWSTLFVMNTMTAFRRLHDHGITSATLNVYHDPKTLTPRHRKVFHDLLLNSLPIIAQEEGNDRFVCRRPIEVPKPAKMAPVNELQQGTSVAHNICLMSNRIIARGSLHRIYTIDYSARLTNALTLYQILPN